MLSSPLQLAPANKAAGGHAGAAHGAGHGGRASLLRGDAAGAQPGGERRTGRALHTGAAARVHGAVRRRGGHRRALHGGEARKP
eukprot:1176010-Prorocentrum_minimum.AAC.1